ncbi:MAG: PHP domain-containing protein [Oscillospiraceae bacterium]|nr:PHP domain-containing protein [Oscillospiraceae bacterium]
MIDLHTHTNYSDGTWNVKTLLENAQKAGVEVLSITDHDTVQAYKELATFDYSMYFIGKLIKGCEFSCVFNGYKIELLGYNFDIETIDNWLQDYYSSDNVKMRYKKEFDLLYELCNEKGIKVSENLEYHFGKEFPIDQIFYDVIKYPENKLKIALEAWENPGVFYRSCTTDENFILFFTFNELLPQAEDISKLIRENRGKVFLAHLYHYKIPREEEFLEKITKAGMLDGVEVYHSSFNNAQIKFLEDYCKNCNLLMSGGTDCHGDKKPERKLGVGYGNMNINKSIIRNWI